MKKKPYRFWKRKDRGGVYYVQFSHIPGKWIATGEIDRDDAVLAAERILKEGSTSGNTIPTLKDFAKDFFSGSDPHGWRRREEAMGRSRTEHFFKASAGRLKNYIIPEFGNYLLAAISPRMIQNWILSIESNDGKPLSDNTRNKILQTFKYVMQEAKLQEIITSNPLDDAGKILERNQSREILTKEEIKRLFPEDEKELLRVWLSWEWASFFMIELTCGLRPGEVAALQWQDYRPGMGFVIHRSYDYDTRGTKDRIKTDKKGMKGKPAVLIDIAEKYLLKHKGDRQPPGFELIFKNTSGGVIIPETSNKHFKGALKRAGIERRGRTQYSLRHTYDTFTLGELDFDTVNRLMGHTSYRPEYDHREADRMLPKLDHVKEVVEGMFTA